MLIVADPNDTNAFGTAFRNYEDSVRHETVLRTYTLNHTKQTVDFVQGKRAEWLAMDHGEYTIEEVIELLDTLVDESDPDIDIANSIHDFQTAERIRKQYPGEKWDWFHLVGLLHDLGKVMSVWGEPQWCVVGDTFPVGCKHSDAVVFPEGFAGNPDNAHPIYSTDAGMYKDGCGIQALTMSWGHDEYMYEVLKQNGCTIPWEGLAMIRYHSFYPWHTHGAYTRFEDPAVDGALKEWVLRFNQFDLYSKGDAIPDVDALKPYYLSLLKKYNIDGKLKW